MKNKINFKPNLTGWLVILTVIGVIIYLTIKNGKSIINTATKIKNVDINHAYGYLLDKLGLFKVDKSKPKGERNNNPGNLILTSINWKGKVEPERNSDGHFEQFYEMKYGVRAMLKDIMNDIKKGKDTLTKLISEYAPSHENNTSGYISTIVKATGKGANDKLTTDKSFLKKLVLAMTFVENGKHVVSNQDFEAAWSLV